jgi:non-ribosomal peptide synthetase component E (peptide arylation enzyme)
MSSLAAKVRETERRPALTAEGLLRRRAREIPDAPALADPPSRDVLRPSRSFCYRDADAAVDALAARFSALGLKPGDRIAMQLPNRVEQPLAMLAAWRAGLAVCALPMLWRHLEIAEAVAALKPKALIGVDAFADESPLQCLCEIAAEASVSLVLGFGAELPITVTSLDAALDAKIAVVLDSAPQGDAPLLITFAARAGASLVPVFRAERELLAQGAMTVMALKLDRSDVILNPYPLTAPSGLALGLMPWLISGCTLLQHQPFDAAGFAQQLIEGGATVTALPSAVIAGLQSDGALDDSRSRLKRLGRVWSPAELAEGPSPEAAEPDFDVFPLGGLVSLVRHRQHGADPTLLPLGKVQVTGADGHKALFLETTLGSASDCGEAREIRVRGPICPRGSTTDEALAADAQGFVGTGLCALAFGETGGALKLMRGSELRAHGGFAIATGDLDDIYRSFSGFLDAACFVLPDPIMGDRLLAAVVPKPGRLISIEALHRFLHHRGVAPYKHPERLITVDAIPRDETGRVLRDQLAQTA